MGKYDLSKIIREFPDLESTDEKARNTFISEADSVLQSVLGQKKFVWIFERRTGSYAELPFLYNKGRSLISGKIDRVVVKEGKGLVIDYKAILIENEDALNAWKDHYRPQLTVYCEAVKEIFKLESVEGYILFLDSARLELTAQA
jgi:ATP-dependent exoDNAse (exonuclease V) beta subunit